MGTFAGPACQSYIERLGVLGSEERRFPGDCGMACPAFLKGAHGRNRGILVISTSCSRTRACGCKM